MARSEDPDVPSVVGLRFLEEKWGNSRRFAKIQILLPVNIVSRSRMIRLSRRRGGNHQEVRGNKLITYRGWLSTVTHVASPQLECRSRSEKCNGAGQMQTDARETELNVSYVLCIVKQGTIGSKRAERTTRFDERCVTCWLCYCIISANVISNISLDAGRVSPFNPEICFMPHFRVIQIQSFI